jgi:FAD dependent oxidoreductase
MQSKSIAVIGAGIAGVISALELADRGNFIVLYDVADKPMTAASYVNEGKIHLGFVYGADQTADTVSKMLDGALSFRSTICRWLGQELFDRTITEPFEYAVPEGSQLSSVQVERHFSRVSNLIQQRITESSGDYLGQPELSEFRPLKDHVYGSEGHNILSAYSTPERAVDTHAIASALQATVFAHPNIEFKPQHRVLGCSREQSGWIVRTEKGIDRGFQSVLNAAWENRRLIDYQSGFRDSDNWFLRYKCAAIFPKVVGCKLKNLTLMLGKYGDVVRYRNDRVYISWYPQMMVDSTHNISMKTPELSESRRSEITRNSIKALTSWYPPLERYLECEKADLAGGFITAQGKTDIDDRKSELHRRTNIGPLGFGDGYFSLETGKYTTAPLFAIDCANMISPASQVYKLSV